MTSPDTYSTPYRCGYTDGVLHTAYAFDGRHGLINTDSLDDTSLHPDYVAGYEAGITGILASLVEQALDQEQHHD